MKYFRMRALNSSLDDETSESLDDADVDWRYTMQVRTDCRAAVEFSFLRFIFHFIVVVFFLKKNI